MFCCQRCVSGKRTGKRKRHASNARRKNEDTNKEGEEQNCDPAFGKGIPRWASDVRATADSSPKCTQPTRAFRQRSSIPPPPFFFARCRIRGKRDGRPSERAARARQGPRNAKKQKQKGRRNTDRTKHVEHSDMGSDRRARFSRSSIRSTSLPHAYGCLV